MFKNFSFFVKMRNFKVYQQHINMKISPNTAICNVFVSKEKFLGVTSETFGKNMALKII